MFRIKLTMLLLVLCLDLYAYDFETEGVYYKILSENDKTVSVTEGLYEYRGTVDIPKKVEYNSNSYTVIGIDPYAFSNSRNLISVILPETLEYIGSSAFYRCEKLVSLNLPNSITDIGEEAFYGCIDLKSMKLPKCISYVCDSTFYDCSNLESVTIPKTVVSVGERAFDGCEKLEAVYIEDLAAWCGIKFEPNGGLSVGMCESNPLYYAHNLYLNGALITDLIIPNEVVEIYDWVFYGASFSSVTIPNNVIEIGEGAFLSCDKLNSVEVPKSITKINNYVFAGCKSLTSVILPDGITSIGDCAFLGCSGLYSFVIPETVTSIGGGAFTGCSGLEAVHISDLSAWCKIDFKIDVSSNPYYFDNYSNPLCCAHNLYLNGELVTDLVIPDGITSIGGLAFYNCYSLTSVRMPQSVNSIGCLAFGNCQNLKTVTITQGNGIGREDLADVRIIGDNAFSNCYNLVSIDVPKTVESIGKYAFINCNSLKCVNITDLSAWCEIDFDGYEANPLYYAHNLYLNGNLVTELVVPDGVSAIREYAFITNENLTSINIPNSVIMVGANAFYGCSGVEHLIIQDGEELLNFKSSIEDFALETVYVGRNFTDDTNISFADRKSLLELTIGKNVSEMKYSFSGCNNLAEINSKKPVPPVINDDTFDLMQFIYSKLNIPVGSLSAYQNADYWKNFFNISEKDFAGIKSINIGTIEVISKDGCIYVNGIRGYEQIEVYAMNGQLVYKGLDIVIPVLLKGYYVVKVKGEVFKVLI